MLQRLEIRDLAIIDSVSIEFDDGFNVITGETGAGKSILIKALHVLFGDKAGTEMIRKGADSAEISACFYLDAGHPAVSLMDSLEIPTAAGKGSHSLIIRRRLSSKSRSQAWINDRMVTTTALREIGEELLDVFAQHENHKLLNPSTHMQYLDEFLEDRSLLDTFSKSYSETHEILSKLRDLAKQFASKMSSRDILEFRREELSELSPSREDYAQLILQSQNAKLNSKQNAALEHIEAVLDSDATGNTIDQKIRELTRSLSAFTATDNHAEELCARLTDLSSTLEDVSFFVSARRRNLESAENEIESVESRLAAYQALMRKLHVDSIDGLIAVRDKIHSDLEMLENTEVQVRSLLIELKTTATKTNLAAASLSEARHLAAKHLRTRIESELKELAMPHARLEVEFTTPRSHLELPDVEVFGESIVKSLVDATKEVFTISSRGSDSIQFMFSANKGQDPSPLHRTASGGEVSRIMLGFKRALAAGAETCLIVFDEIDSGISGRVADIVGKKLRELSRKFQILCISHLAQVSAYADAHFVVEKFGDTDTTSSCIKRLSANQSIEELARLLSGTEVTKQSLANAKALIASSRN